MTHTDPPLGPGGSRTPDRPLWKCDRGAEVDVTLCPKTLLTQTGPGLQTP